MPKYRFYIIREYTGSDYRVSITGHFIPDISGKVLISVALNREESSSSSSRTERAKSPNSLASSSSSTKLSKTMTSEEAHELTNAISEEGSAEKMNIRKDDKKKKKLKERLQKEATKANNRGVCYLSRIPPHMDHVRLRQILAQFGEIERIYLAPENPEAQVHRKRAGGFRGQLFSEGWVEFAKKSVAKRVAEMLNGEQIGGKKKSTVYYDLWNIKYLTKFKWDDLTEEIAYKSAIREQKLNMVMSVAKREKDFYLSKVEKSRAMTEIDERMKKKRKIQEESGSNAEAAPVYPPRVIRQFRQKKSIKNEITQSKPGISTDVLASVFGGS